MLRCSGSIGVVLASLWAAGCGATNGSATQTGGGADATAASDGGTGQAGNAGFVDAAGAPRGDAASSLDSGSATGVGNDAGLSGDAFSATDAGAIAPEDASIGGPIQVIVSAGSFARTSTVVSFSVPASALAGGGAGNGYVLRDSSGNALPLQVDATGTGTFLLPSLAAGSQATFVLEPAPASSPSATTVTAAAAADGVTIKVGTTTAFHYQTVGKLPAGVGAAYLRGGYIHPVFTPSGALVTDDYPPDHRHHHGIWSAWTKSMFQGRAIDFWNMGEKTAKVDFVALDGTWNGPVHGGLRARHAFTDLSAPQPVVALDEEWVVTAYALGTTPAAGDAAPYFLFDVDSTQQTATTTPLMLLDYYYGGFGIRGNASWFPANFLTSEGLDRVAGDGKTGRWLHIGGMVGGKPAGYAILGHPTNFRAPQPMRLNPTDPFMSYAPPAAGAFSIDPGTPYKTRFRFVVSDGPADAALLDRVWNDYATPPTVVVRGGV